MGSRHLEAGAVGPQEATAPAQARGTPRRAPPHWAIPYLKRWKPSQVQATDSSRHSSGSTVARSWTGGGVL